MSLPRVLIGVAVFAVFYTTALPASLQNESRKYIFSGAGAFDIREKGYYSFSVTYSIPELSIQQITTDNGFYYNISIPGHHQLMNEPGKPALPVISKLIIVPDYSDIEVTYTKISSITIKPAKEGIKGQLYPAQLSSVKSDKDRQQRFLLDRETYNRNSFSRSDTLLIEYAGNMRGEKIATLLFIPARYNPVKNEIEVITSAEIFITLKHAESPADTLMMTMPPSYKGHIKSFAPEQLINGYSDKPAGMIILSDTAFRKQLEPLIRWKTIKGFRVSVIYRGKGLAGTTFQQLKDTIYKVYQNTPDGFPPPDYLLIVGDLSRIPRSDGTSNLSDLYYGEFDGNCDFLPEMYIGRIPARNADEVRFAVDKILEYEKQVAGNKNHYHLNTLVTAGEDAVWYQHMNGHIDYASEYYLNLSAGFNATAFRYPGSGSMSDSVKALVNNGLSFVNYTGHGLSAKWNSPEFTNDDAANLTNAGMYPFVISNACLTGNYGSGSNLGTALILGEKKGAVGFIGCTNDSYWNEDYYYALGAGTAVMPNPPYDPGHLGFYDRLFHRNGEAPSKWFYTMGHVNFAGLLAVLESSSSLKKYYWETYALLGDPSLIPAIGEQIPFDIDLADTIPNGIESIYLQAPPFAYAAVSDGVTLWDASFVSPAGFVRLSIPKNRGDSCLLVITSQGRKPYIKTHYFGEKEKAWLEAGNIDIDDTSANNNGKADYGETIQLGLTVMNLGNQPSSGCFARLSSSSEWATLITDSVFIGNIAAKSQKRLDKAFTVKIGNNIPDQGRINIVITLTDSLSTREYLYDIIVQAPDLSVSSLRFDDRQSGNGNLLPDCGETLNFVFSVYNSGSSNAQGYLRLANISPGLIFNNTIFETGIIPAGGTAEISVRAMVSSDAYPGTRLSFESTVDCGYYTDSREFVVFTGKIIESFEYGGFNLFPWINTSPVPWIITETDARDGLKSAMSGAISHNSTSALRIKIDISDNDTLRFWYKVSSEQNYDFLKFIDNGVEIFSASGESGWLKKEIGLPGGAHTLEWVYSKDASVTRGFDRVWIDLIEFPSTAFVPRDIELISIESPSQQKEFGHEKVTVKVRNNGDSQINGFYLAYCVEEIRVHVSQYFPLTLPYRDSLTVTFDKLLDLSKYGIYTLQVYSFDNDDDKFKNDTLTLKLENTHINAPVRAFPNPADNRISLHIASPADDLADISIMTVSGVTVRNLRCSLSEGDNDIPVYLNGVPAGVYIINIKGNYINNKIKIVKL